MRRRKDAHLIRCASFRSDHASLPNNVQRQRHPPSKHKFLQYRAHCRGREHSSRQDFDPPPNANQTHTHIHRQ